MTKIAEAFALNSVSVTDSRPSGTPPPSAATTSTNGPLVKGGIMRE